MRNIFGILLIMILAASCNTLKHSKSKEFNITVIDKEFDTPIDSSKVVLTTIVDSKDIFKDVKYTNKKGECNFKFDYPESAQYQVRAVKEDFLGYYDKSYINLNRAISVINEETGNDIILYLTSDSLNHYNYWTSVTPRIKIDSLINLLKSNKYPLKSRFPLLLWEDIPELLEIGNDTTLIDKYPRNLLSSTHQEISYLGIISLWFIESIRIAEQKKTVVQHERFPSMTPSLHYKNKGDRDQTNSIDIMKNAYSKYLIWWNEVKTMDIESACKIDPLKGTNMKW